MKYVVSLLLAVFAVSANAQYTSVEAFPNLPNFDRPLDIANAGDGTNRLFIAEQKGKIFVIENSPTVSTRKLFVDLSDIVSQGGGEMGLLGLTFHPNYKNNGYFYVNYTTTKGYPRLTSVTSRLSVSASNKDSAVRSSELVLHTVQQPYDNHNGGCIKFGPDGYLYISMGDGGSGGDPQNRAQNLDSLLGKILRLDVDNPADGKNYSIPPSNPFASHPNNNRKQVFAYGLRNVWRMSFDTKTGKLWGGDVGQQKWEEIDIIESGKHYGWKTLEGTHCYSPSTGCDTTGKVMPVFEYEHLNGNVSVTGGYVYRGEKLIGLYGRYIYADYANGNTWSFDINNPKGTNTLLQAPTQTISSFGVDEANELYACRYTGKRIFKFVASNPLSAPILTAPKNDSMNTPTNVTLRWNAVTGAQYYQVMVADDASFTQGVLDTSTTLTTLTLNFAQGTKHYWRVKAWNNITVSDWSTSRTFTTFTPLTAPILIAPKNDTVVVYGFLPFSWMNVNGATSYRFQVNDMNDFSNPMRYDNDVVATSDSVYLIDGVTYYWRVRAKNASETGPWSEVRKVIVEIDTVLLLVPQLLSPSDYDLIIEDTVHFRWTSSKGADVYRLNYYRDSTFAFGSTMLELSDTSLDLETIQFDDTTWWRVRAHRASQNSSEWSSPRRFFRPLLSSPASELESNSPISIYPNPTTGSFTISSESEHIKGIRIYDVKGATVAFERSGEECTLTKPVAGTYFVEVELRGGGKVVKKIVVE
jgi:glucose/arabinose dehydrogenase